MVAGIDVEQEAAQAMGQWIALGGAGVLLLMLLRAMRDYQKSITDSAIKRAEDLDRRVTEQQTAIDELRAELRAERSRCDGLQLRLDLLTAEKTQLSARLEQVARKVEES